MIGVADWKGDLGKRLKELLKMREKEWEEKVEGGKQMEKLKKEDLSSLGVCTIFFPLKPSLSNALSKKKWENFDDYGIAISLTLHEFDLFSHIQLSELLNWHKKNQSSDKCLNMSRFIAFSNSISGWFVT